jgi:hypothetical protein
MDKETKQYYEQTIKQFEGDEKKMIEHFNKVIEYQKKKTLDKMVNHFMTLIVGSDVEKLDRVIETHNKLVEAYKEHGFYNNEKPFELYRYLMSNTLK